jgi:hypothetical protein
MRDEQIDRLLDEGLKNYSRVEPPGELAERILAARDANRAASRRARLYGAPRRGIKPRPTSLRRWWLWAPIPALAAALIVLALMPRRVAIEPQRTQRDNAKAAEVQPQPVLPSVPSTSASASSATTSAPSAVQSPGPHKRGIVPRRSIHVLTPEELATMTLPDGLFPSAPPPAELSVAPLTVPEIVIAPIEIPAVEPEKGSDSR